MDLRVTIVRIVSVETFQIPIRRDAPFAGEIHLVSNGPNVAEITEILHSFLALHCIVEAPGPIVQRRHRVPTRPVQPHYRSEPGILRALDLPPNIAPIRFVLHPSGLHIVSLLAIHQVFRPSGIEMKAEETVRSGEERGA